MNCLMFLLCSSVKWFFFSFLFLLHFSRLHSSKLRSLKLVIRGKESLQQVVDLKVENNLMRWSLETFL